MFLLEDVQHLAASVHGNLEAYLAKREAARLARIAKAENKKQEAAAAKIKASSFSSSTVAFREIVEIGNDEEMSNHGEVEEFPSSSALEPVEGKKRELIVLD
jgi:hypothetical protein